MQAGNPAQPVAVDVRGRPLSAHPERATSPPPPLGAGPGEPHFPLSFCLCPHPCLDPLPSPVAPSKGPHLLGFSNVPQVTLLVPRCPPWPWMNTSIAPFGNYDSLAHVEGPRWPGVTPPQDQLPLNPPGTGEGPLGGEGRGRGTGRGRSHLTCPATAILSQTTSPCPWP